MSESGGVQLKTSRSLLNCVKLSVPAAFPGAAFPAGVGRVGVGRWAVNGAASITPPSTTLRIAKTTEDHRPRAGTPGTGTNRLTRPRQRSAARDDD